MPVESLLAQTAEEAFKLEAGGAVVMTVSILLVVSLTAFCLYRLLREKAPCEHDHAPPDVDSHNVA